jgi:hypothetical protein
MWLAQFVCAPQFFKTPSVRVLYGYTVYSSAGSLPSVSHLTSCTPTKSNLYFGSSFATVISEPAPYLLTCSYIPSTKHHIHFPDLMSFIRRTRRRPRTLVTCLLLRWGVVSPTPKLKLKDHPFSALRYCLFSLFAATLHIWRQCPPAMSRW